MDKIPATRTFRRLPMIYYVEDDPNIRELTSYALRQAGFEAA